MILHKKCMVLVLTMLLLMSCLTGCFGRIITEDAIKDDLPDIDPSDGIERTINVTLYYRLTNEKFLIGIERGVQVYPSERTEAAVIRALLESEYLSESGVSPVFPAGTYLSDVNFEGGILYVTLSGSFVSEDEVNSLEPGDFLSAEDYDRAVAEAREEMYLKRRLGVYSIVNTISGGADVKVQILVDTEGDGTGKRLPESELGLDGGGMLAEPMGFNDGIIATPQRIAECLYEHMMKDEYDMAYPLVANNDGTDGIKPLYADFETAMLSLGKIAEYTVTGIYINEVGQFAVADITIITSSGTVKRVSNAMLTMVEEGDYYKVGYGSLKALMES